MTDVVLPTLKYANNMRMDCNATDCIEFAMTMMKYHENHCSAPLQIHHQKVEDEEGISFQVIVRHDFGEAVMIKKWGASLNNPLFDEHSKRQDLQSLVLDWLEAVHKYEGVK